MSLEIDETSNRGKLSDETIDQLFSRLKAEDIEQFYMAYQLWSQRQQIEQLQLQMLGLQQKISENAAQMAQFQPSAIALASLAQLQACGVEDTDLLDRMLERGEEWLDHSIQLLERCEQMDLIGGDYTQWCIHALDGAYDWLDSMADPSSTREAEIAVPVMQANTAIEETEVTEEQLLKKLMSEEGDAEKVSQESTTGQKTRITQPLTIVDEQESTGDVTQKVAAVKLPRRTTQPLPATGEITIADEQTSMEEDTIQVAVVKPPTHTTQPLPAVREVSDQEPHPANIEEHEINTSARIEKLHETASPPSASENEAQENATVTIEPIDQDKNRNDAEKRYDAENKQQGLRQDLPSSKKMGTKRKKGFLRWLLAKVLRR